MPSKTSSSLIHNHCTSRNGATATSRFVKTSFLLKYLVGTVFALTVTRGNAQVIGVIGPAIDEDSCYADLRASDNNNSKQISEAEFVTFISLQSDSVVADTDTDFASLPADFINLFTSLACKCEDCKTTCDESFSIKGTGLDENTSDEETVTLFNVCSKTYEKIQGFVPETLPPVPPPVPTDSPTKNPTAEPTPAPSKTPSESPSKSPTKTPTISPTKNPTKPPTPAPTDSPTISPAPRPTPKPTPSPTPTEDFTGNISIEFEFTLGYERELSAMDVMEDEDNQLRLNMIESIDSFVDWIVSRHFSRLRKRNLLVTNQAQVLPTIFNIEERGTCFLS